MESTLILLGLILAAILIGTPIATLVLLSRVRDLRDRVSRLEAGQPRAMPAEARVDPETKAEPKADTDTGAVAAPVAAEPPPIPPKPALPWPARADAAPEAAASPIPSVPRGPSGFERVLRWVTVNWFYAVSAVSLALAGLFMVQYGIENGLIPPHLRVLAALTFGAALIGAGEWVRRRHGDDETATTAYLPSVFSGAGIVSLFGGILAARLTYGLIGPELALIALALVALLAMGLGWLHGPLLAAAGVIGGFAAPMVVGGASDDPSWVFIYFAFVAGLGLGIDTLKRWAWVSGLSLALGIAMGWLLFLGSPDTTGPHMIYAFVLAMCAVLIPARAMAPDHEEPAIVQGMMGSGRPIFPVFLAATGTAAASVTAALMSTDGAGSFWLAIAILTTLGLALILWSERAPGLQDQALMPLAGLVLTILFEGLRYGPVARIAFDDNGNQVTTFAISTLVAIGGLWSLAAAWRSWRGGVFADVWAGAAALIAPALAVVIDQIWSPLSAIGQYPWALHAAAIALGMTLLAERFARLDRDGDRLRAALFALSALSALTFACVILLSETALTLAFAASVLAAAWLDRRFDLRPMTIFIAAGVAVLGYRLLADPGLDWALDAPMIELLLVYGGTLVASVLALGFVKTRQRETASVILDVTGWSLAGLLATLLLYRGIDAALGGDNARSHWALGLFGTVWFGLALAQLTVARRTEGMVWLRNGLAGIFAFFGVLALGAALTFASPLGYAPEGIVAGPAVFNTLIPAYLIPAALLGLAAWRLQDQPSGLRIAMAALATAFGAFWLFLAIRQFWQGSPRLPLGYGFSQHEISTYTFTVLLIGAGLFYQSLARGSALLRRAGLIVIGLGVAKVFLIDIGNLGGLNRVFSFLLLGLGLAGLAWLNTWAQRRETGSDKTNG